MGIIELLLVSGAYARLLDEVSLLSAIGSSYVSLLSSSRALVPSDTSLNIEFAQPEFESLTDQISAVSSYLADDCGGLEIDVLRSQYVNDFDAEVAAILDYYNHAEYTDSAYNNLFDLYNPMYDMLEIYISAGTCQCDALSTLSADLSSASSAYSTVRSRYAIITSPFVFPDPSCTSVCPSTGQCSTIIPSSTGASPSNTTTSAAPSSSVPSSSVPSSTAPSSSVPSSSVPSSSVPSSSVPSSSVPSSSVPSSSVPSSSVPSSSVPSSSVPSSSVPSSAPSTSVVTTSSVISSSAFSTIDDISTITLPYTTQRCRLGQQTESVNTLLF